MANPRQRRKARSSTHKPVKHSRRTNKLLKKQPPIRGPKILQDSWDKQKTVRQNYAALGLAHTLTPFDSGGKEAGVGDVHSRLCHNDAGDSTIESSSHQKNGENVDGVDTRDSSGSIPRGFGRIIRDADGSIVSVELGEDSTGREEGRDLMEEDEDIERVTAGSDWLLGQSSGETTAAIAALEKSCAESSAPGSSALARKSSSAEARYLQDLVRVYGRDVERMAKDRKRNRAQYTAGQLVRAIGKAGGFERLGLGLHLGQS